jgi:hypothetical protein
VMLSDYEFIARLWEQTIFSCEIWSAGDNYTSELMALLPSTVRIVSKCWQKT